MTARNWKLATGLETGAPYIFILEDDVILADGWFVKTMNGLHQLSHGPTARNNSWIYLRLFYTETSLTWSSSDFWYRNMPLAFLLVMGSGCALLLAIRRHRPTTRPTLNNWTIAAVCLVVIPVFTGLLYMVGKYSLLTLESVVEINGPGCCAQGLVFPREQVPALMARLQEKKSRQTDSMIENMLIRLASRGWRWRRSNYSMLDYDPVATILKLILKAPGLSSLGRMMLGS